MTMEIMDISHKLCVLISKKPQTLRVSEKTNHKEKKNGGKVFLVRLRYWLFQFPYMVIYSPGNALTSENVTKCLQVLATKR